MPSFQPEANNAIRALVMDWILLRSSSSCFFSASNFAWICVAVTIAARKMLHALTLLFSHCRRSPMHRLLFQLKRANSSLAPSFLDVLTLATSSVLLPCHEEAPANQLYGFMWHLRQLPSVHRFSWCAT